MRRWAPSLFGSKAPSFETSLCHRRREWPLTAKRNSSIAALLSSGPPDASEPQDVTVKGFVRSVRKQKRVAFAALGDGSCLEPLQVVLTPEQAEGLSTGAAVSICGKWLRSPSGKQQSHELAASNVALLGDHDSQSYPLQKKYHSPEFLRALPHLRPRIPQNALLLRLRSQVIASLTTFFGENDFVQTHPPIITSSDCEGAGEVFSVVTAPEHASLGLTGSTSVADQPFFRTAKYLTVSSQLHLEALAQAVTKVWTLSPTFRAERSDTARHLSEFYMLEAEVCFTDDLESIMTLVENMVRCVVLKLQASRVGDELLKMRASGNARAEEDELVSAEQLKGRWTGMVSSSWPRITYADAVELLQQAAAKGQTFEHEPKQGSSLQAEHEKHLAQVVGLGKPVFVTQYPRDIKAFYMAPSGSAQQLQGAIDTVECFDLLVPDLCELAGGSLREHRLRELQGAMEQHGLAREDLHAGGVTDAQPMQGHDTSALSTNSNLRWYLDLRRYGSVPHGGFGLGFDRLLSYLAGVPNVRDVVAFPRWYGRCDC